MALWVKVPVTVKDKQALSVQNLRTVGEVVGGMIAVEICDPPLTDARRCNYTGPTCPYNRFAPKGGRQCRETCFFFGKGSMIPPAPGEFAPDKADRDARIELLRSDAGIARGLEDLVTVLITKGTIELTDLPVDLQTSISDRASLRDDLVE